MTFLPEMPRLAEMLDEMKVLPMPGSIEVTIITRLLLLSSLRLRKSIFVRSKRKDSDNLS